MFSVRTGASKVALVFLIEHLKAKEFTLLDTQYITPHLQMFGAAEIPRKKYMELLRNAIDTAAKFI